MISYYLKGAAPSSSLLVDKGVLSPNIKCLNHDLTTGCLCSYTRKMQMIHFHYEVGWQTNFCVTLAFLHREVGEGRRWALSQQILKYRTGEARVSASPRSAHILYLTIREQVS